MSWNKERRDADQDDLKAYEKLMAEQREAREAEWAKKKEEREMGTERLQEGAKRRRLAAGGAAASDAPDMEALKRLAREEFLKKRVGYMDAFNKFTVKQDAVDQQTMKLTKREMLDIEHRQAAGDKVRAQKSYDDIVNEQGFTLKQEATTLRDKAKEQKGREASALLQRYEKTDEVVTPFAEQADLERRRLQQSGALKADQNKQIGGQDYDLVMEDEIEFITEAILAGKMQAPVSAMSPEEQKEAAERARKQALMDISETRKTLPIYKVKDELVRAVVENQVIIMVGETGSGKTTQLAQYLVDAGLTKGGKKVGCTQPRRVAAMSVAARVAKEMNVRLGSEVGYSIRFEDCTNEKTVVKYMTDGMLLREFLSTPDLEGYSCMIIDEAHERSLHTDILFGLIKDVARFRNKESGNELKIIISSATLQSDKFASFFDGAKIFNVKGRTYPVEVHYTKKPEGNYIEASSLCALQIHAKMPLPGDILIFLCGQDEIEECAEDLTRRLAGMGSKVSELIVAPIYSTLPTDQQSKIFEKCPEGARKVVIATNIAETSLTIDGIVYVIDCGFCKQKSFNPRTLMEALQVVPISRAQAEQRKGRAGRTQPGKCFRLYTMNTFRNELDASVVPEIQRTNLGNVVLLLKSIGVHEILQFEFMDSPSPDTLKRALQQLFALGAINDVGQLTKVGRMMAEFPLDPQLAKMLCSSKDFGVSDQIVTICAMLSVGNSIFHIPRDKQQLGQSTIGNFFKGGGDHLALCNVYEEWQHTDFSEPWCYENYVQARTMKKARDIRDQMAMLAERAQISLERHGGDKEVLKCITSGFFYNAAQRNKDGKTYKARNPIIKSAMVCRHPIFSPPHTHTHTHIQDVLIHPGSFLAPKEAKQGQDMKMGPKWVVFHELVQTNREYMRQVCEIQKEWLVEIAPHLYKLKDVDDEKAKAKAMPRGSGLAKRTTQG